MLWVCVVANPAGSLVLASASPRRSAILRQIRVPHRVAPIHVDETPQPGESPDVLVERIVEMKLGAAVAAHPKSPVLVADTIVVCDGVVFGKPIDAADLRRMTLALSGGQHLVTTRYAIRAGAGVRSRSVSTSVHFRELSAHEVDDYVATSDGRDKAGGYAVQGLAARFVVRLEGSYTNVVGLPACEVTCDLAELGLLPRL